MQNTVCPICEDVLHSHTWKTIFIITAIIILQTIDIPLLRWQTFLWFRSCCYANRYPGDLVVFAEVRSSCRQAATHAGFDSKAFTNTVRILQSFISTPWYFYKLHTHRELLRLDHLLILSCDGKRQTRVKVVFEPPTTFLFLGNDVFWSFNSMF